MTGLIFVMALFFGSITLWAGIDLVRMFRKRGSQPQGRPQLRVIAPSPRDPRGALMMRERGAGR